MHAVAEHLLTVSQKVRIAAPPARVLEAWSGPLAIARWYVERRCGDALLDRPFVWYEPRATSAGRERARDAPPVAVRWLRFLNDHSVAGDTTELRVAFDGAAGGTLVTLEQCRFDAARQAQLPRIASGWSAALQLLKAYVEDGAALPRHTRERVIGAPDGAPPDTRVFARAIASIGSIAAWAKDQPSCLRLATPHDAVLGFYGLPGLVSLHLGTCLVVSHTSWSAHAALGGQVMVDQLAERLAHAVAVAA